MCCASSQCKCPNKSNRFSYMLEFATASCLYSPPNSWMSAPETFSFSSCMCVLPTTTSPLINQQPSSGKIIPYTVDKKSHISNVSYWETGSLYPTPGASSKDIYNVGTWDNGLLLQLLKCRAAIVFIANNRNKKVAPYKSIDVNNALVKKLLPYHMIENLPTVDYEISDDPSVAYYLLSSNPNAVHPGIDVRYWNAKIVKSYGAFYNSVTPFGPTYVIFYSATKKHE